MIKRNVLANVLGGVWNIFLSLALIPIQVKLLGVEAYGLIGFISSLQLLFTAFDLGLSTTITRELASDTSVDRQQSRAVVQTINTIYWIIGLCVGAIIIASAHVIAYSWLDIRSLSPSVVVLSIQLMAITIALRWPVSIYNGVIAGLQRMTVLNILRTIASTLRLLGGIIILFIFPQILSFIIWQAVSGFIEVLLYALACKRLLPGLSLYPRIDSNHVRKIWRFSLGINTISLLALIFTQSDRIILGKFVTLEEVGYYSLAYNLASGLSTLQGYVTSAAFPALALEHSRGAIEQMRMYYKRFTQIIVYTLTMPACIFIFYGRDILVFFVPAQAAIHVYTILQILVLGFLLNAALSMTYTLSIATGNTRYPLVTNLFATPLYVLGLYVLVVKFGSVGAATAWLVLNIYYILVLLPLIQRNVLGAGATGWIMSTIMPFFLTGFAGFFLSVFLSSFFKPTVVFDLLLCIATIVCYCILGFFFLDKGLRTDIVIHAKIFMRRFGIYKMYPPEAG